MPIKYKALERKNPQDRAAAAKWYASAVSNGSIDLDSLSAAISDGSTVRQADVYAVLIGLVSEVSKQLADGKIVKLGKLGSFTVNIGSNGVDTEEEVNSGLIKSAKIVYRPASDLKNMLKTLSYEKE